jgi:hypothetical protein
MEQHGIVEMQQQLKARAAELRADMSTYNVVETCQYGANNIVYQLLAEYKAGGATTQYTQTQGSGPTEPIRYEATGKQIATKLDEMANALGQNSLVLSTERIVFNPNTFVGDKVNIQTGSRVEVSFHGDVASRYPIQPGTSPPAAEAPPAQQVATPQPQQAYAPQTQQSYPCHYCHQALTWIPHYQRWYCYYCQRYI